MHNSPENPMVKFEKLREMEEFSEAMFNRNFAFQEKNHPAWDAQQDFGERIKDLPLHALIFSNPDRDPATHGPTVSHFYPLHWEILKIAQYARQVAEEPVVCDLHCTNGFVGSLVAREGVKVVGVRNPGAKANQIADFYDPECYDMRPAQAISDIDFVFDVALSAWMPAGINLTPDIIKHRPKLIVFIHTNHVDESTQLPQTGTPEAFTELPDGYKLIDQWSVKRPEDLLHDVWPDLTPSIEEVRHVKIYADSDHHGIGHSASVVADGYAWEKELDMAQLALEAKEHLRSRGIPV
ncbi:MAG: hypothetical protein GXP10_05695 [Gammaproteobacteria bacterium]|nr:hypothetical protein [Gammaproteobacteria bacterium]